MKKVLIGCEESQAVLKEFRLLGIEAYSCDILETSGEYPEFHIRKDILEILNDGWDMMIAFPPCTDLAVSGARWFEQKRLDGSQQKSIEFFMALANAPIEKIAIENPVGIMSNVWRKPNQIIQPYQFGHPETKKTCLWLKNLPPLEETNNVKDIMEKLPKKERNRIHYMSPGKDRGMMRSKTYQGIAKAMAEQWSRFSC